MRWLAVVFVLASQARAQWLPAASTVVPHAGETHAWFAGRDDGEPPVAVYHLPPRGGGGPLASGDGVIALAGRLRSAPEQLAAFGSGVVLFFPPSAAGLSSRRVLTITASRTGLGDAWAYDSQGRLVALPSLPGDGELAGVAGLEEGAAVLLRRADGAHLLVLGPEEWEDAPLPRSWSADAQPGGVPLLVTLPGAVGLLDLGSVPTFWTGRIDTGANPPAISWRSEAWPDAPLPEGPVVWAGGRLTYAVRRGESLSLWQVERGRAVRLCELDDQPGAMALAAIGDRVALVTAREVGVLKTPPGAPRRPSIRYHVTEVSALTGRVLYDGAPLGKGPVSAAELRVLAAGLLLVMVLVLVVVLRPESPRVPLALPPGLALAEGSRRWTATLIDGLLAVILGAKLAGVPLMSAGGSLLVLSDPAGEGGTLMLTVLGVALLHATLGETLFGRTLGKWLTACRVVRAGIVRGPGGVLEPRAERPALWRSLTRNVVKWGLPPIALAGINSSDGRHRGDVLAGTAVVVEVGNPG